MTSTAGRGIYRGLFLVSVATLMYQILLTRIFSVTMWYHFAFAAISVTMFGFAAGAILVYLLPHRFTVGRTAAHLTLSALGFGIFIVISTLAHLLLPFGAGIGPAVLAIPATYVIVAVPFTCAGVCVCLALTRFPGQVGALYAADLAGAALGCVLLIYVLRVTDAPTAVFLVGALPAAAAAMFASEGPVPRLGRAAFATAAAFAAIAVTHTVLVRYDRPVVRLLWAKGSYQSRPLYEKWNSFSRIRVVGDLEARAPPSGWGLSSTYPPAATSRELFMNIDAAAGTVITGFDGDLAALEHLRYDVVNLAHYLRPDARVLVVGTGGGRDILSALAFNQRAIIGVEINEDIIATVNERFGEYTGHLDRHPRVHFVNDEARSYVARMQEPVDIIQISLIDTWAATASGAFTLTENSLYTVEAWKTFLDRLAPGGILTVSRWYFADRPGEVYRLATLAAATLREKGVDRPRDHFVIVRHLPDHPRAGAPEGVGTILVSREPLSARDLAIIEGIAGRLQFQIMQHPSITADPILDAIASGNGLAEVVARHPLNIAPPTDDSPFFFHMLRLPDVFNPRRWNDQGVVRFNLMAVAVLGVLLLTVSALTALCIVLPLALTTRRGTLSGAGPLIVFFAAIGFGFMLVEVSQVQRLIVFLGHPTYSLSVVLFSLLLSSGLGSLSTQRAVAGYTTGAAMLRLTLLVTALLLFGSLTPVAIREFQAWSTPARIGVATGLLFPLGFFMGMPFPLGMALALRRSSALTPWLWGINGATSVCASVLAVVIAIGWGISVALWTGIALYALAALAFAAARREHRASHPSHPSDSSLPT